MTLILTNVEGCQRHAGAQEPFCRKRLWEQHVRVSARQRPPRPRYARKWNRQPLSATCHFSRTHWHGPCGHLCKKNMRTLLRHASTGQYFQSLGNWTTSPQNAHDFGFIARALRFVGKTGFADMELILSLDHPGRPRDSIFEASPSQLQETRMASQSNHARSRKGTAGAVFTVWCRRALASTN